MKLSRELIIYFMVIDAFRRLLIAAPPVSEHASESSTDLCEKNEVCLFGAPELVVVDREPPWYSGSMCGWGLWKSPSAQDQILAMVRG